MRHPLRADENPLDVVSEMVQPDAYGVLQGWQVCCELLKHAVRRCELRISLLEDENVALRKWVMRLETEASQHKREGEGT
jgi:hypothetical protein